MILLAQSIQAYLCSNFITFERFITFVGNYIFVVSTPFPKSFIILILQEVKHFNLLREGTPNETSSIWVWTELTAKCHKCNVFTSS